MVKEEGYLVMGTCVAIARASQPTISLPRLLWPASATSVAMHGSYRCIATMLYL